MARDMNGALVVLMTPKEVVGQIGKTAETGRADGQSKPLPIGEWFQSIVALETTGEKEGNLSALTRKCVLADVQAIFAKLAQETASELDGLTSLGIFVKSSNSEGGDKGGRAHVVILGDAEVKIPYVGRVVEEAAAMNMPKQLVLPIGQVEDMKLFIEGTSCTNIQRSFSLLPLIDHP